MVAPSALAETVTPPIVSPAADLIEPERMTSAANAAGTFIVSAKPATAARLATFRMCFIARSPLARSMRSGGCGGRRRRGRRRQSLDVGDDRVDLIGREMILEARHIRR